MFFEETVPKEIKLQQINKIMETPTAPCPPIEIGPCTQFMLYTIVSGFPRALVNTFGQISKDNVNRLDRRDGICRPTVCCIPGEHTFTALSDELKRELGPDLAIDITMVLQRRVMIGLPSQNFYVALVGADFVSKIYTPVYSGGIRYIAREQIPDIEEVSGQGTTPINPTRIRMLGGHGWKKLLKEGFDVIDSMPK